MRADEHGAEATAYQVIPRVLVFLTRGDEVLLLEGAPHKRRWAGKLNGLGGHVEPGENVAQAARREVREECGLEVTELTLRAVIHITLPQPPGIMMFVFTGPAPEGQTPHPSREGTPRWIKLSALEEFPVVDDLPLLVPRVVTTGPVFYGHYTATAEGTSFTFEEPSR